MKYKIIIFNIIELNNKNIEIIKYNKRYLIYIIHIYKYIDIENIRFFKNFFLREFWRIFPERNIKY